MPIKPVNTVLQTEAAIDAVCERAKEEIMAKVLAHYRKHPGNAWSGHYLVDLEKAIKALYRQMGVDIGTEFRRGLPKTMREFYDRAAREMAKAGRRNALLGEPDTGRVNYFLNSGFEQVAMRTTRMSFEHVKQLRTISADVLRTASLTGATRAQVTKEMLARATEIPGFKFTAANGAVWKDQAYFKMLARTELMNAGRAAYDDKCAAEGCDVVMLDYSGNCCDACGKWEGQLFSLTGATPGLATKADLAADGVFHPNCTHSYSAVPDYVQKEDFSPDGKPQQQVQTPEPEEKTIPATAIATAPSAAETHEEHLQKRQQQLETAKANRLQRECKMVGAKPISTAHTNIQDLAAVNPNYNPMKNGVWENNCQRCVTAYEARRRGLDVVANPLPSMSGYDNLSRSCGWADSYKGGKLIDCGAGTGLAAQKKIIQQMDGMPDGARCAVQVLWKGRRGGGHVFIAEKQGGKTMFFDPQQCGQPVQTDYARCFSNANGRGCYIMRLDNLKFSDTVKECCNGSVKK